ncbi:MAG TPA: RNA 2',3'-cyclic phosphodiesterase [Micromonosporaceae bacterium]
MRLFIAVYPSAEALDDLSRLVRTLAVSRAAERGVNARVIRRPLWHVTAAFLGDVDEQRLPRVHAALDAAVAADGTGAQPPTLAVGGGGRFGRGRFTLLWAGLRGEVPQLSALASRARRELRRARVRYDEKPFRPHLTIARPGDRISAEAIAEDIATLDRYHGPRWSADQIHLVRSTLGPHPVHETIAAWSVTGARAGD